MGRSISQYVGTFPIALNTGDRTTVAASATAVTLLAARTARMGAVVVNDSTATLYLAYGSDASTTSYTYRVDPSRMWEMPFGDWVYVGLITGIWDSATGNARITEIVED